jgi:hypothetical protein
MICQTRRASDHTCNWLIFQGNAALRAANEIENDQGMKLKIQTKMSTQMNMKVQVKMTMIRKYK